MISVCLALNTIAQGKKLAVIAYYAGPPEDLDQFNPKELTHIIFSFGHLQGNQFHINNAKDTLTIQKMIDWKKQNPELKVMLSLGGWGGCAPCSTVFSTDTGREEFASSVKEVLDYFKADGIDLDWEYPAILGFPGHAFKPEDKDNFTALIKSLRASLPAPFLLTFAAGGFQNYLDSAVDWKQVMPVVDFVNIMSYDLVSGYSTVTGHHTPLFSSHPEMQSTDRAVKYLLKNGVSSDKLVIGAAFYGRVWEDVPDVNRGLFQPGKFFHMISFHTIDSIFATDFGYKEYWSRKARAPYAYNASKHLFMTYESKRSVRLKTKYAIRKKLHGIMFWQLRDDKPHDGLLEEIYTTRKRLEG